MWSWLPQSFKLDEKLNSLWDVHELRNCACQVYNCAKVDYLTFGDKDKNKDKDLCSGFTSFKVVCRQVPSEEIIASLVFQRWRPPFVTP